MNRLKLTLKHCLYDHHLWISALMLLVVLILSASINWFRTPEFIYPAVGAIVSLNYFLLKQHLEEARLFKELFKEFNARYGSMNEELYDLMGKSLTLDAEETKFLYDYFNLCAEEYLYYRKGFIYQEVWFAWLSGMRIFYADARIRELWKTDLETDSCYGLTCTMLEDPKDRNQRPLDHVEDNDIHHGEA